MAMAPPIPRGRSVILAVGPEGGFTPLEEISPSGRIGHLSL